MALVAVIVGGWGWLSLCGDALGARDLFGIRAPAGQEAAQGQPGLLFPDLRTVAADDPVLDFEMVGGRPRYLIRFSTTVWNAGEGPLELRGDLGVDPTVVYQRVFDRGGGVTEYPTGTFSFQPSHGHWHFENFARYELWTQDAYEQWLASGRTVGEPGWLGSKTTGLGEGFCLRDSRPFTGRSGTPLRYASCETDTQGISVGWSDVYSRDLPDQWVDVGEDPLPDGNYALRLITDPFNLIYESPDRADPARESAEANEAVTRFNLAQGVITILPAETPAP
jgi:hypothetical protein